MAARRGSRTTLIRPACRVALAGLLSLYFSGLANLTTLPALSSPSSQSIGIDLPLTVDLNDYVSAYGGFSGTASRTSTSDWSAFTISSWNVGFQADVYQQNGGSIPTITLQSTVTRSIPDAPLATTSLNTILEFDYALNEDETKGFLAGSTPGSRSTWHSQGSTRISSAMSAVIINGTTTGSSRGALACNHSAARSSST